MGFRELHHTADWAIRVWAADLTSLMVEAARGFYAASLVRLGEGVAARRTLLLRGSDSESLLVTFLTELIYVQEKENLGLDAFQIQVKNRQLSGSAATREILSISRPIKAVTFHQLEIRTVSPGLQVDIVFDV